MQIQVCACRYPAYSVAEAQYGNTESQKTNTIRFIQTIRFIIQKRIIHIEFGLSRNIFERLNKNNFHIKKEGNRLLPSNIWKVYHIAKLNLRYIRYTMRRVSDSTRLEKRRFVDVIIYR